MEECRGPISAAHGCGLHYKLSRGRQEMGAGNDKFPQTTRNRMKHKNLYILLILLGFGPVALADFNSSVINYASGKYDLAYREMQSLAETAEHPLAMYYLGVMTANGQGVEQDYQAAAEWYRKAAKKGVMPAQYRLAKLYEEGKGVPRDLEYAYAWLAVASAGGHKRSIAELPKVEKQLSEEELASARKLARKLLGKYKKQEERTGGAE
ncbi:MAG: sel1 repeat family protein [Gammaproteobacteria bacterium]|nr:MAG: sel1 repeat family protein [Gammaproteobacteria bacterium]